MTYIFVLHDVHISGMIEVLLNGSRVVAVVVCFSNSSALVLNMYCDMFGYV